MTHASSSSLLAGVATANCVTNRSAYRPPAVLLAIISTLVLVASPLLAQGTIAGTVVGAGALNPIEGVQIVVDGTNISALSDVAGRFRLTNVPGTQATLRVRRLQYQPLTQVVRVGATDVRLVLTEVNVRLDEIVVTGTPVGIERRAIGNSVSTINAPQEVERSGVGDIGTLINARATGVIVTSGTGRAGSGPSINIRGRSTISLNQQPLLYIDGVRVANDIGTGTRRQGGSIASRLNDLSPEDIESVEIIKGPAAATIYGTEAANGVVQIITKKGRSTGSPRWGLSFRQGTVWFQDPEGRIPTNYAKNTAGEILSWNAVEQEEARGTPIWENGHIQSFGGTLNGGSNLVRYYLSSVYDTDKGIEPNNTLSRYTGHANVTVTPSEKFDVNTSINYVTGITQLGQDYGLGTFWGALYGSPLTMNTPRRGFNIAPPEVVWGLYKDTQEINRFTGSTQFNHRPAPWFTQRLIVGLDQTSEDNQSLTRFAPPEWRQFFTATVARGQLLQDLREITHTSADYSGTATFNLTSALTSSSSIGAQHYKKRIRTSQVTGREFPAPNLQTAAAAAIREGTQDFLTNTTIGLYAQEQFGWQDRLFLTGAVRIDNNSAFGEDFDLATYPKVSATWVASEEPFWKIGWVDQLKLRAAFGQSGQQPDVFTALRTFQPVTGTLDQPVVTPQVIGNPDLKPERGEELEVGFEAGLFNRLSIDFTYFTKKTKDAILLRPIAPSLGFPGSQYVNIGEVSNKGAEVRATLQALSRENLGLEVTANLGTTKDRIEDLGGIPFIAIPGLPQRHVEGYPIAGLWAKRVTSATLSPTGVATNVLCDGGPGAQPMPCAQAPVVFLGTSTPKATGAVSSTLTLWKRLRLYGLVDFKRGHKLLDTDGAIRCAIFLLCDVNVRPQNYDPRLVANAQNGSALVIVDQFIRDASFAKLREVSASYALPERWARLARASQASFTLVGRNLHTWTDYPGLDPESRSAIAGQSAFDQAVTPTLAQFIATLNLSF